MGTGPRDVPASQAGTHTGLALLLLLSISWELLLTSLTLDLSRRTDRKICWTLWCPCAREGWVWVLALPGQGCAEQGAQPGQGEDEDEGEDTAKAFREAGRLC